MKSYLILERQPLPNYVCENLWKTVRRSARVHGYRSVIVFGLVRWKDHVLNVWSRTAPWNKVRIQMQKWRGVSIGKQVHLGVNVTFDFPFPYFIIIEDGVSLAGNDYVLAHSTPMEYHKNCVESFVAPTIIRKNAWVGINVTILPGIEIGEGAIVAAGSVVTQNVPPNTLVAGVPAKVVKTLDLGVSDG